MTSKARHKIVPAADPSLRFAKYQDQLHKAVEMVMQSKSYILGDFVSTFEKDFATYLGVAGCVGVNSCTDAITLCLLAEKITGKDEIITTGLTAPATAIGIINAGATPVIVDIEKESLLIDPKAIEQAITKRTKAIIPVHLHGYPAHMEAILEIAHNYNLIVIEDCAQSHGATYRGKRLGSLGHYGVFSFYPTKNLGCMGDGGLVAVNDQEKHQKLLSLRNYGFSKGSISALGINSRLDEIQAAVLQVLLPYLDESNVARRNFAKRYSEALKNTSLLLPQFNEEAVYHQYVIRSNNRDKIRTLLKEQGVETGLHYHKCLADHPALKPFCKELPNASKTAKEVLSLPIQPEILEEHFEYIVTQLKSLV